MPFREGGKGARTLLELVTDVAEVGAWAWNRETGETSWNDWHARLLGYDPRDGGWSFEDFASRVHPEDLPSVEAALTEAIETGELYQRAYRVVHPDGTIRHLRGQGRVVLDDPRLMVGVVVDITDSVVAAQRERELLRGLAEADDRARRSVAADIHDGPLQQLFVAKLTAESARRALERDGVLDMTSAPRLDRVVETVERAQTWLRSLLLVLAPPEQEGPVELAAVLRRLADDVVAGTTIEVDIDVPVGMTLAPEFARTVLQVVGEALMNVRKHAGVDTARVRVERSPSMLHLDVEDHGVGFDVGQAAERGHFGRSTMAGRAVAAGGVLDVRSAPGAGTRVRLSLPHVAASSASR